MCGLTEAMAGLEGQSDGRKPMPDEPSLPTEDDLKKLPLLAIVAYTVRCARRFQPLYRLASGIADFAKHEAAVERAISVAEQFCHGHDVSAVVDAAGTAAFSAANAASHDAAQAAALAAAEPLPTPPSNLSADSQAGPPSMLTLFARPTPRAGRASEPTTTAC